MVEEVDASLPLPPRSSFLSIVRNTRTKGSLGKKGFNVPFYAKYRTL